MDPGHVLFACPDCGCHARAEEQACPHCGSAAPRGPRGRTRTRIAVLLGLSAAASVALSPACAYGVPDDGPPACDPDASVEAGSGGEGGSSDDPCASPDGGPDASG